MQTKTYWRNLIDPTLFVEIHEIHTIRTIWTKVLCELWYFQLDFSRRFKTIAIVYSNFSNNFSKIHRNLNLKGKNASRSSILEHSSNLPTVLCGLLFFYNYQVSLSVFALLWESDVSFLCGFSQLTWVALRDCLFAMLSGVYRFIIWQMFWISKK